MIVDVLLSLLTKTVAVLDYLVKNRSSFRSIGWLADVHRDAEVHFEKGRINKNIGTTNRISFWSLHWLAVDWQSIGWMLL
ncbi:Glutamate--tRNA ligase [Trichinella pseudospiralis]